MPEAYAKSKGHPSQEWHVQVQPEEAVGRWWDAQHHPERGLVKSPGKVIAPVGAGCAPACQLDRQDSAYTTGRVLCRRVQTRRGLPVPAR